jgi:hypothetical protein
MPSSHAVTTRQNLLDCESGAARQRVGAGAHQSSVNRRWHKYEIEAMQGLGVAADGNMPLSYARQYQYQLIIYMTHIYIIKTYMTYSGVLHSTNGPLEP